MCATGLRFQLQVCESVEAINDLVECDGFGRVSASGADLHLLVVLRVDADVCFNVVALKFDNFPSDRPIRFRHLLVFKLTAQPMMLLVVLGDDQHAAGVAIQPMQDAGTQLPSDVTKLVKVKLQCSGQHAAVVSLARMHDHPDGFVDHDRAIVLGHNIDRNVFGRQRSVGEFGQLDRDAIVHSQSTRHFDGHGLLLDGLLKQAADVVRKQSA